MDETAMLKEAFDIVKQKDMDFINYVNLVITDLIINNKPITIENVAATLKVPTTLISKHPVIGPRLNEIVNGEFISVPKSEVQLLEERVEKLERDMDTLKMESFINSF